MFQENKYYSLPEIVKETGQPSKNCRFILKNIKPVKKIGFFDMYAGSDCNAVFQLNKTGKRKKKTQHISKYKVATIPVKKELFQIEGRPDSELSIQEVTDLLDLTSYQFEYNYTIRHNLKSYALRQHQVMYLLEDVNQVTQKIMTHRHVRVLNPNILYSVNDLMFTFNMSKRELNRLYLHKVKPDKIKKRDLQKSYYYGHTINKITKLFL